MDQKRCTRCGQEKPVGESGEFHRNSSTNKLTFIESCIIKYACRHRVKNGIEDVRKIIHYAELLIELEYCEKKA